MAGNILDVLTAAWINVVTSMLLLLAFAVLKNQPMNARVYFPKWFLKGQKQHALGGFDVSSSTSTSGTGGAAGTNRHIGRFLNLNVRSYAHVMDWIWTTLRMPEAEVIEHAGLDSAVLLRVFLLGLKIFSPMLTWGCLVLIPINKTDNELVSYQGANPNFAYSAVDTISIANVQDKSKRLWAHLLAAYMYTAWTCLMLFQEYEEVESLRFNFLAAQKRRPDQFTILVRQVPKDRQIKVSQQLENFFKENHAEHYCTHQVVYNANHLSKLVEKKEKSLNKIEYLQKQEATRQNSKCSTIRKGFLGLAGEKVDALDFYTVQCNRLSEEIKKERCHILTSERCVMKAGFVSFNSRWGAAVCAQTQQSKDSTCWLTDWAPEARDVCWDNLSIPYMELNSRRLLIGFIFFCIVFFFMIPITFVQSLANLDALNKNFHFLKPLLDQRFIRSVLQGFLPGLSLKLSLTFLPQLMMLLSKFEGRVSLSKIERNAATKYFVVMVVNVFFGNVIVGSVFEQLKQYVDSPIRVPKAFGSSIPMKSTFFITYIMVDGWSTVAAEALRLWPFLWYHLQNMVIVKTEKDRNKAMAFTTIQYNALLPKLGLYFLLGLVYAVISPLILPFIIVFFAFGYIIYRNQVINVYEPKYESSAACWPLIHRHIVVALLITHITLIGLFSIKRSAASTPLLLPLPILTVVFHWYCTERFGPAFYQYPLQEARAKDNLERTLEPSLDVRSFLETAYLHPAITAALVEDTTVSLERGGIHNLLERPKSESSAHVRSNADGHQLEPQAYSIISIGNFSANSSTSSDH